MKSYTVKASTVRSLAETCTIPEMAVILNISANTARDWCKKLGLTVTRRQNGASWTEKEDATLRSLWTRGIAASIIAERLPGRNRDMVLGRAHRLGLPRHRLTTQPLKSQA